MADLAAWWWKARWTAGRAWRRWLLPEASLVFGYLAEDLIAARLLDSHLRAGYYVDVGCHDPVKLSNTLLLHAAGWRGINIDANPAAVERMRQHRPGDVAVWALVGRPGEDRELVVFGDEALSSADPGFVGRWEQSAEVVRRVAVRSRSLTDILEEHAAPADFDFLNVDVEGMELEVLESLDLDRFRPRLIALEIHGFDAAEPASSPVIRFLAARGYALRAYNGLTAFVERRADMAAPAASRQAAGDRPLVQR
jgi:FkbM family methyltransferase